MENYKILGIDRNASMEEVQRAYKNKVREYRENITDEKRANAFIKVFDKAYEEIKMERIQNQQTMPIDREEYNINNQRRDSKNDNETRKRSEKKEDSKKRNKSSSSSNGRNKNYNQKSERNSNEARDKKRDNSRERDVKKQDESSLMNKFLKLPFKIILLPIVVVLSLIIALLKVINMISWVASKIVIIAAIATSAIHGYQIYIGHAIQYKVFIISGIGFIVALCLPFVLKTLISILESINNGLKKFI